MLYWVAFIYILVSFMSMLAGIALCVEWYRKEHNKSGNWAYNTYSLITITWLTIGTLIVYNM